VRVALLYPQASHISEFMKERAPLGIAYLAAFLEQNGHQAALYDLNVEDDPQAAVREAARADLVGISILSVFYVSARELITKIRSVNPAVPIVVGGSHVTALPRETLRDSGADFAVAGDGEDALLEIARALASGADPASVAGIWFRDGGEIRQTEERPPRRDLDALPFPARHLLKMDRYVNPVDGKDLHVMITSRGCPFHCFYCAKNMFGIWRPRSAENVLDELQEIRDSFGAEIVYFHDDLFTTDKKRVIAICRGMIERGIRMSWLCTARVDTIDEEMLEWMKRAGCRSVHFGIESGVQEILDLMKKKITLAEVRRAVEATKRTGIYSKAYFIIGFPWDTDETIETTIDFALSLPADEYQFTMLMPYPGTECWDEAIRLGRIDPANPDWNAFFPTNLEVRDEVFFTNNLTADRVRRWRKVAYRRAVVAMAKRKLREGDVRYLLNLVREKRNLGLSKFMRHLFLKG